ncbi:MAG: hypothetical protein GEV08_06920 [Acidimicrobiia bacterium]|nr:hypothetical protein [Acidimicrobiia bacterium]
MRVVAWNIKAGGTGRTAGVVERLEALRAEVAVVGAVPPNGGGAKLRGYLEAAGFEHQVAVEPPPRGTTLLVASREPISAGSLDGAPVPASWLHVEGLPFELGAVYGPGQDGDPAASGARARWLDWLGEAVAEWRERPALLCGDFHTGRSGVDVEGVGGQFQDLLDEGWRDLFRERHGEAREWSWWSPDGSSGRLDHALGSPALEAPVAVSYAGAAGLTEHRPLVVDVAC